MKRLISFFLLTSFIFTACDKSGVDDNKQGTLPFTNAVKTGDWMVTYFENDVTTDTSLIFLKFNTAGTLIATKEGALPYNGSWTEANTGGNNTLTINIATSDAEIIRVNRTWKVTNISEDYIDLKDANASSNATLELMKH